MQLVPRSEVIPHSLLSGLADREISLWVRGPLDTPADVEATIAMVRLPWKQVYVETADPRLVVALEEPDDGPQVRRRGFVHVVDSDPSRMELPARSVNGHRSFRECGHPIFPGWRVRVSVISRGLDRWFSLLVGGHAFSAAAVD